MTQEQVLGLYKKIDNESLTRLFDKIIDFLSDKGVDVEFKNLSDVIELDVYKIDRTLLERDESGDMDDQHHETCLSDGMSIWLHDNLKEVGGITGRLYDLLHVGCGHLWQWSAEESSGLGFYGDKAWEMGSQTYLGKPMGVLKEVEDYEREAGILAAANLRIILEKNEFEKAFAEEYIQFFTDYLNADLGYIITYYHEGRIMPFFEKWKQHSGTIDSIRTNFPMSITRRSNRCIAVIRGSEV